MATESSKQMSQNSFKFRDAHTHLPVVQSSLHHVPFLALACLPSVMFFLSACPTKRHFQLASCSPLTPVCYASASVRGVYSSGLHGWSTPANKCEQ